jgi:tetratricopeptide (TPR) repeat protein
MRRGAETSGVQTARLAWALLQIANAQALGEPSSIAPRAEAVLAILVKMPTLLPYTAWVLAATDHTGEARDMLRRISSDAHGFPWLIAAADATVLLRDRELAERFYEPLAAHQYENRIFWGPAGVFCLGPTQRTLGDLAMVLGRPEDALRHYDDAIAVCERVGSRPLLALSRRGRESALAALSHADGALAPSKGQADVASAPDARGPRRTDSLGISLRREGDVWAVEHSGGPTIRVKDGKGLRYLERLLGSPGTEVHVLELAGIDEAPADAGSMLDAKAKDQYKERLDDLRSELEEATRLCDTGRAERARAEIDAIAGELASAVGLGGRDRKAASNVERARVNVQRRLRDTIERISELDPGLGRYLDAAVRTGTFCIFLPP